MATRVRKSRVYVETSLFPGSLLTVPFPVAAWSTEQKRAFGARTVELRGKRPQRLIAELVTKAKGKYVSEKSIRNWETGTVEPQWENLVALAAAFGVSVNMLSYGSEEAPEPPARQLDRMEDLLNRLAAALLEETVGAAEADEPPDEGSMPVRAPRPRRPR